MGLTRSPAGSMMESHEWARKILLAVSFVASVCPGHGPRRLDLPCQIGVHWELPSGLEG